MFLLARAVPLSGLLFSSLLLCQTVPTLQSVSPKDFAVMAWGESPSNPDQLREMKEAGLNISGFCKPEDLDKVKAAGLTCFVRESSLGADHPENLPSEVELRKTIARLKTKIDQHPAALGVLLRDEPTVPMMAGLGTLSRLLREAMPEKWSYVNLFPTYVSPEVLGTKDYDSYVRMQANVLKQPFLSYDHYALLEGEMRDGFYTNLEIFRRIGLETHRPFWNCILSNTLFSYMEPSDATFRLQVYSTLAYGGRGIQYFTYFSPPIGNFRLAPIDHFGNRTATWDMLRRVNNEIHTLAPTLTRLQSTGVYHFPDVPGQGQGLWESRLIKRIKLSQSEVRAKAMGRTLVGEFEDAQKRPYFMVVNKDLNNSFAFQVELREQGRRLIHISPYSGQEVALGGEMNWLAPGAGMLFRVE